MIRITLIAILAMLCTDRGSAQFLSSFHEQELVYNNNPQDDQFYRPRSERPKVLTYVLPSFSVTLLSPKLTYGNLYVPETKTLNLVAATDSGKDFDLQLSSRFSYGGLKYKYNKFNFSLFHEYLADAQVIVPNQIFELATEGNNKFRDSSVDIDPSIFLQSTHKWSVGVDYQLDKLMVGMQVNVYSGNAYLNTNNSNLNIDFEENFFEFGFNKDINVESSGSINYHEVDSIDYIVADNVFSAAGSFSNLGLGISAQFRYEPFESLKIFGRVDDLGYIKWKDNTEVLTDQSFSQFGGFDIRQYYVSGEPYSVTDTLYSKIDISKETTSFSSALLHSIFIGVDYKLNKFVSVGGMIRSRSTGISQLLFLEPQVTVRPLDNISLSIGNIMNRNTLLNPKVVINAELGQTFGFNLALVNPWKFGKYYDASMLHASLGMYVKFLRED